MKESKIRIKRGFLRKAGPTVAGAVLSAIGYDDPARSENHRRREA